ncbi:MAG: DUF3873 family protein [Rikenellaceae bacterium]
MTTLNNNGVSTCPDGEERYVAFNLTPRLRKRSKYIQFDFRDPVHGLFSCISPTLEQCRAKRNKWLEQRTANKSDCQHHIPANYSVSATCAIGGYCNRVCGNFQRK